MKNSVLLVVHVLCLVMSMISDSYCAAYVSVMRGGKEQLALGGYRSSVDELLESLKAQRVKSVRAISSVTIYGGQNDTFAEVMSMRLCVSHNKLL